MVGIDILYESGRLPFQQTFDRYTIVITKKGGGEINDVEDNEEYTGINLGQKFDHIFKRRRKRVQPVTIPPASQESEFTVNMPLVAISNSNNRHTARRGRRRAQRA